MKSWFKKISQYKKNTDLIFRRFVAALKFIGFFTIDSLIPIISFSNGPGQKKLFIVRLDAIGDYILFRNFLEETRNEFPDFEITLCGNILWKDLAETFDLDFVDHFIWIHPRSFRDKFFYRFKILRQLARQKWEIAIQPTYSRVALLSESIIKSVKAKSKIGCTGTTSNINPLLRRFTNLYYSRLIPSEKKILFEFDRNKEFFESFFQKNISFDKIYFTIDAKSNKFYKLERFVTICPGASLDFKRWCVKNFAHIAKYLIEKYQVKIICIGSSSEKFLAKQIVDLVQNVALQDWTGKTNLKDLPLLLSNCHLLVTNDTSALHFAAAVNTNTICISKGDHFGRFTHYSKSLYPNISVIYPEPIQRKIDEPENLSRKFNRISSLDINSVSVDSVINLADQYMKGIFPVIY